MKLSGFVSLSVKLIFIKFTAFKPIEYLSFISLTVKSFQLRTDIFFIYIRVLNSYSENIWCKIYAVYFYHVQAWLTNGFK